jgi:hypothetical protein
LPHLANFETLVRDRVPNAIVIGSLAKLVDVLFTKYASDTGSARPQNDQDNVVAWAFRGPTGFTNVPGRDILQRTVMVKNQLQHLIDIGAISLMVGQVAESTSMKRTGEGDESAIKRQKLPRISYEALSEHAQLLQTRLDEAIKKNRKIVRVNE